MFAASKTAAPAAAANYIEDVFSTYLYTGNGSTQTITNGIDLSTKGGLVWIKNRNIGEFHRLYHANNTSLCSNNLAGQQTIPDRLSFASNGFNLLSESWQYEINYSSQNYASWTFRKQPKFFDVVTYTGDGSSNRNISHSLGSTPGCIIVKRTNAGGTDWWVWHRSISTGSLSGNNLIRLNLTSAGTGATTDVLGTASSTTFQVGFDGDVNGSGDTYVAYLFAHNAGGFGLTGTDNVISCGSFTTDGSGYSPDVNLGYEPQWILLKPSGGTGDWLIVDTMRGWVNPAGTAADDANLRPNKSDAEALNDIGWPTATGFNAGYRGTANNQWIYIAIRRGPMKTPTTGTSVYNAVGYTFDTFTSAGFNVDAVLAKQKTATNSWRIADRLRGVKGPVLYPENTSAEAAETYWQLDVNNGVNNVGASGVSGYQNWMFQRAPGFFDVVCYTGSSSAITLNHNLGVVPEMIIVKNRNIGYRWAVTTTASGYSNTGYLTFDANAAGWAGALNVWNNTSPTSTQFTVGTFAWTNDGASANYVAYLFASCPGVSKVGSYTGTGALQTINCGFTGGARFVLIKRTDSTGDWFVYDSTRGISSGNDPYLLLNSATAEVTGTNYVDTTSVGFQVTAAAPAGLNANGGTYIFLAIA